MSALPLPGQDLIVHHASFQLLQTLMLKPRHKLQCMGRDDSTAVASMRPKGCRLRSLTCTMYKDAVVSQSQRVDSASMRRSCSHIAPNSHSTAPSRAPDQAGAAGRTTDSTAGVCTAQQHRRRWFCSGGLHASVAWRMHVPVVWRTRQPPRTACMEFRGSGLP